MWQVLGRDADARIGHAEYGLVAFSSHRYRDGAPGWSVLQGVVDQVDRKLGETGLVACYHDGPPLIRAPLQAHTTSLRQWTHRRDHISREQFERQRLSRQRLLAGIGPGQSEQVAQ